MYTDLRIAVEEAYIELCKRIEDGAPANEALLNEVAEKYAEKYAVNKFRIVDFLFWSDIRYSSISRSQKDLDDLKKGVNSLISTRHKELDSAVKSLNETLNNSKKHENFDKTFAEMDEILNSLLD